MSIKQWIVSVVVFLGAGAGLGNLGNLEGDALPIAGQVVTLIAVGLLGLIKMAKDEDKDNVPDVVQGTWAGKVIKYLVPILLALAGVAGVTMMSGCSGAPVAEWVNSSIKGNATVRQGGRVDGVVETNHNFLIYGTPVSLDMYYADRSLGGCITISNTIPICYKHVFEGDQDGERGHETRMEKAQNTCHSCSNSSHLDCRSYIVHRRDQL